MFKRACISTFFMLCIVLLLAACGYAPGELEPTVMMTRVVSTATATTTAVALPTQNDALLPPPTSTLPEGYVPPTVGPTATFSPPPTSTPLPLTDPVVEDITTLPAISQDVLFIADGALKLWDHTTSQVETLLTGGTSPDIFRSRYSEWDNFVGDIVNYSISADGRSVVASRYIGDIFYEEMGSAREYELIYLNLNGRQAQTIATNLIEMDRFSISPDGDMVAYAARTPGAAANDWSNNTLSLVHLADGTTLTTTCNYSCNALVWQSDSHHLFWTDKIALWLLDVTTNQSEMVIANHVPDPVTAGDTWGYSAVSQSPNDRFLVAWKWYYEGAEQVLIDLTSKTVIDIDGSDVYLGPYLEMTWLPDSRLYILRPAPSNTEGPTAELWHVDTDNAQLVVDQARSLSDKPFMATAPHQLADGRLTYTLVNYAVDEYGSTPIADDADAGLYVLADLAAEPQRVGDILPTTNQGGSDIVWQSDGAGAIVRQANEDITLYVVGDNSHMYNIHPLLGLYPHQFTWVAPLP